jgi:hypothetical protein
LICNFASTSNGNPVSCELILIIQLGLSIYNNYWFKSNEEIVLHRVGRWHVDILDIIGVGPVEMRERDEGGCTIFAFGDIHCTSRDTALLTGAATETSVLR